MKFLIPVVFLCLIQAVFGQPADSPLHPEMRWRMIGPYRGGRTVGATGVPARPGLFYIGVNNGGVWKTTDYGMTWVPIFDDQPTGSIGALAVAPGDPDILYVGSGEGLQRPDLSVGDGMFKSLDGGKTWLHLGLSDAQQIAAVQVDPRDPEHVFVAVLGHPYGPNEERGVFETSDGGKTWRKSLYIDENTGASGLEFSPDNPDVLYADMWAARQGPWENAAWQGATSGLFKSTDGGRTWEPLKNGLPTAEQGLGRIGFAIAPSSPNRLYATVDAQEGGGIYRSDDAGQSWRLLSQDRRLWGRGGDFAELKVHPKNPDIVYVANVAAYVSRDGGLTYTSFKGAPGGDDYHRIWINPNHPEIMLMAADQGATITVNGGETWSSWYNQPTAQLYHVSTDRQFPYNVYGGQQESGAIGISSRGDEGQITFREWRAVGADEYAYVAADPLNPNIVYGGRVTRFDKTTGQVQNVAPEAIRSGRYRTLRTMPLLFSPADPRTLFFATNVLFKTRNGGHDWEVISPDLSRERPEVPASIGVYATPEMADMARRGVIYALGASPLDVNVIWAGTDDGLVHVTTDGGKNWRDVTPPGLTAWSKISQIDAGRFDTRTAYIAVNRIRLDDMRPHVYRTHDGGANWTEIVTGFPDHGPVNVVREDPLRRGLLFAGTERDVHVSLDDGDSWRSLRLNMPASSIRDLVVHDDDLVAGTHGRSIWILDDITPLRQITPERMASARFLFHPRTALRVRRNTNVDTPLPPEEPRGQNPPDGAIIDYWLKTPVEEVALEILDEKGDLVRRFSSSDQPESIDPNGLPYPTYWIRPPRALSRQAGMHRFVWDLHYPPPPGARRTHPISAIPGDTPSIPTGPLAHPGRYTVRLRAGAETLSQPLTVLLDPRVRVSEQALRQQFELSMACYQAYLQAAEARNRMDSLRARLRSLRSDGQATRFQEAIDDLDGKVAEIAGSGPPNSPDLLYSVVRATPAGEETLVDLQQKFLYLITLLQSADAEPTSQVKRAVADQQRLLKATVKRWNDLESGDLESLLARLGQAGLSLPPEGTGQ